jgi:hypothetical protein
MKKLEVGRHIACIGYVWNAYVILVGRSEQKALLGRPRFRREDNINIDIKEIVFEEVDCVHLIGDGFHVRAVENTIMESVKGEECTEWMGDH